MFIFFNSHLFVIFLFICLFIHLFISFFSKDVVDSRTVEDDDDKMDVDDSSGK